jgi:hypothetical protein
MMEHDILDQLYFGEVCPWERFRDTQEIRAVRNRINTRIQALDNVLPEDAKALLKQLMNDCSDLDALAVCESFKEGYRLGTRLTAAAFSGEKQI